MNYKKIYEELIDFRKNNPVNGYFENHHILPRSLGGSDDSQNIVRLSAREHFVAHLLLTRIHNEGPNHHKMIRAFVMMLCHSTTHQRYSPSRRYEILRKKFSRTQSLAQTGSGNSQYGTSWIYHELIGAKKVDSGTIPEYIEQGWFLGRTLKYCKPKIKSPKYCKPKMSEEYKLEKRRKKTREKYPNLEEWYDIYSKFGFEVFVEKTGYQYSQPNLVNLFSRNVKSFKPQNGKKRGK